MQNLLKEKIEPLKKLSCWDDKISDSKNIINMANTAPKNVISAAYGHECPDSTYLTKTGQTGRYTAFNINQLAEVCRKFRSIRNGKPAAVKSKFVLAFFLLGRLTCSGKIKHCVFPSKNKLAAELGLRVQKDLDYFFKCLSELNIVFDYDDSKRSCESPYAKIVTFNYKHVTKVRGEGDKSGYLFLGEEHFRVIKERKVYGANTVFFYLMLRVRQILFKSNTVWLTNSVKDDQHKDATLKTFDSLDWFGMSEKNTRIMLKNLNNLRWITNLVVFDGKGYSNCILVHGLREITYGNFVVEAFNEEHPRSVNCVIGVSEVEKPTTPYTTRRLANLRSNPRSVNCVNINNRVSNTRVGKENFITDREELINKRRVDYEYQCGILMVEPKTAPVDVQPQGKYGGDSDKSPDLEKVRQVTDAWMRKFNLDRRRVEL